jgi:hypothetical protein
LHVEDKGDPITFPLHLHCCSMGVMLCFNRLEQFRVFGSHNLLPTEKSECVLRKDPALLSGGILLGPFLSIDRRAGRDFPCRGGR